MPEQGDEEWLNDTTVTTLQEVDIVAVKQQRDISDMAVSGNVIGESMISRDRIDDIKNASIIVPNFYMPDYGSRITSSIYVRGIGARMDQPAVGLTIDNVGVLNKDAYDFDLDDIASIEMLRGPQSALYGRNTMTGLINVRTLSPVTFQGWRAGASYASGNTVKANAGWYHLFTPDFGVSLSAGYNHTDGRFINEYNNRKIDRENSGSARLKLHWQPSEAVTISNVLSSSVLRQGGYPYQSMATGKIAYNDTCFYRRFLITDGHTVNARIGDMQLLSVTSVQHINDNMTLDQDFLPASYFTLTQKKKETALTEDIMLRGSEAGGKYNWLAGVYGFYRHLDMHAPVTFKDTGISQLIESHRNEANPYYPIRWDERSFSLNSEFILPSGGVAIYHESDLRMGRWRLSAGLRLDYERVDLKYNSYCNTSYTIYNNPSEQLPIPDDAVAERVVRLNLSEKGRLHRSYLMFMPKVSALYELPDGRSNLYATIGRGYKAGGFNTQMFSEVLQQKLMEFMGVGSQLDVDDIVGYKPEQSWTYEIGAHFMFPAPKLNVDVSLFFIDCRDQQLTVFPEGQITGRMMTNAGRTHSFGGEISTTWKPVERLTLTANYGYTNARFRQFVSGKNDYKGNRLPYSPSNTLYIGAAYDWHASWMKNNSLEFAVNCSGTGDIYWNEANTRRQNFYAQLGASIAFAAPHWRLEIFGTNLTDTKFYTFYFMSMRNEFVQRGLPPTLGARLNLVF